VARWQSDGTAAAGMARQQNDGTAVADR